MEDFIFVSIVTLTFMMSFSTFGVILHQDSFKAHFDPQVVPRAPLTACGADQDPARHFLPMVQVPGDVYFRSVCEIGSDAPSLILKLKSIACLSWISVSTCHPQQPVVLPPKMRL